MSMRWRDVKRAPAIRKVYEQESERDAEAAKRPTTSSAVYVLYCCAGRRKGYFARSGSITATDGFKMALGTSESPGKFCETDVEVIEHGHVKGRAATRVMMAPKSGRRHQLRVHSLGLGHPIVGDATYNPIDAVDEHPGAEIMPRMMLHAFS